MLPNQYKASSETSTNNDKGLLNKLSHEQWLSLTLCCTVIFILTLISALAWQSQWSNLAVTTLVFFLAYPIIWIAWRSYHFWRQSIMQLTTYTQVIREGETNLRYKKQHKDNLLAELQQEIFYFSANKSAAKSTTPKFRKCIESYFRFLANPCMLI